MGCYGSLSCHGPNFLSLPMPVTLPPGPIPLHPSMQAYPFFGNQNPAVIHNPCSTFVPFMTPNTLVDQQSTQHASSLAQPASGSHVSGKQDSKNKSSGEARLEKVWTDLSSGQRKSKKSQGKENSVTGGSSSSRCSSSRSVQDSSSNSMTGSTKADDLGR
ncbi:hypothetical protein GH714_031843 [Hevea brasiliensis]|uniref:Uncharacterized protein n=1 Tax=Hevea brasiliensis TaxID=3981 RepID=A0A6A6KFI9_HEVBR|nr:hypothetical protein GH714_031843 [Hevea brasiliensis]